MKRKSVFLFYLENNRKSLTFLGIVFIIGIILGIVYVNHITDNQKEEIYTYVNSLKENIKLSNVGIDKNEILKESMKKNASFCLLIWFLGYTLLASFLICGVLLFKGFSIGYVLSSILATLGTKSRNNIYYVVYAVAKYYFDTKYINSC